MPTISVIVPVYNAENTIERCVESVLNQSYTDWELLLVDDGSKDSSGSICDAYALSSSHIRVIHQENQGVSAARNAGIDEASGCYLLFLDGDDYLESDMFSVYVQQAKKHTADIVIGGMQVIGKDDEIQKLPPIVGEFGTAVFETMCTDPEMFGYVGGKMVRAAIVKQQQIRFRTDMQSQEDLEFFLSVYGCCRKFFITDYVGYRYDYSPGKRIPPVWDFIANQMKLRSVAGRVAVISPKAHKAIEERIVRLLFSCLHNAVKYGNFDEAWDRLMAISGLRTYIHTFHEKGEMYKVARWFANERYYRVLRYFKWRIRLKKLVGRG